jgi:anti-anti-sigma factor
MSDDRQLFSVTATEDGNLALAGELDAQTVSDLYEALTIGNGARDVTLDMSRLTFIDSSGLHAIATYAASREPDDTVTLAGVSPHVLRVLEITCLTTHPKLRINGGT